VETRQSGVQTRQETAKPDGAPSGGQSGPPGGGDAPAKKRRPPIVAIVVVAILVIVGAIFGLRYLAYASTHQSTDDARIDADTVIVTSKIAERVDQVLTDTNQRVHRGQLLVRLDDKDEKTRVAQAQASYDAQRAQVNAARQQVDLTRATQVAQNTENDGGISAAEANIRNARATYTAQNSQVAVAQSQIATAQAQLRVAQAAVPGAREALVRANADLARTSALVTTGDLARSNLDAERAAQANAQSQYQQALQNVVAAETQVEQARQRVASAQSQAVAAETAIGIQQGQLVTQQGKLLESNTPYKVTAQAATADASAAQLGTLAAQLQQAKDQLGYTEIRSPIDGFVGAKDVEVGKTVSPGESILTLVPDHHIYVTANFKETQIGKMCKGQDVAISIDAYHGVDFHGVVDNLSPASENQFALVPAQNATGNFVKITQRLPVRILFVDPPAGKALRPGMSVEAAVDTSSACK
jgi:membrane fusion protein (multidrug efflux system)